MLVLLDLNVGKKRFYYLKKIKEFNIKIIYICDKVFKNSFLRKEYSLYK